MIPTAAAESGQTSRRSTSFAVPRLPPRAAQAARGGRTPASTTSRALGMSVAISRCSSTGVALFLMLPHRTKGRTVDERQAGPAVRAGDDRRLLAQEGVAADPRGHAHHGFGHIRGRSPVLMNPLRQQPPGDPLEFALLAHLPSGCGGSSVCLGVSGWGRGVEQREPRHPFRGLPHDLERDIAAHRQSPRARSAAAPRPGFYAPAPPCCRPASGRRRSCPRYPQARSAGPTTNRGRAAGPVTE